MHKLVFAAIAGTATLLAAGAYAADPAQGKIALADSFAALDRNGDHRISRSEAGFDRVMSDTFAEIDTDGDGYVSTAEYAAAEKTRNPVSSNMPNQ